MAAVDAIKALASQLIVWHHLAFYGPMSDVVYPHADGLIGWLCSQARLAVQAFLVLGGFLAARSLVPKFEAGGVKLRELFWRRYTRLAKPYLVALAAAMLAGAIARALIQHPNNPASPSFTQVIAHLFFLQDIAGEEALSAGVWYVAIDFQLYVLLVLILWLSRVNPIAIRICWALAALSLFWLNRISSLDIWAPYFFGSYGLGVLAWWVSNRPRRGWWTVLLAAFTATALAVEWRDRILVVGATAMVLAVTAGYGPQWMAGRVVAALGRISYSVFLIHYPVCLTVNAVVFRLWPTSPAMNAIGMATAWALSMGAGALLFRLVEAPSSPKRALREPAIGRLWPAVSRLLSSQN